MAKRPNVVEREMNRLLQRPPSVMLAATAIVVTTVIVVVAGGILIRAVDGHDYPDVWIGMWWALQTVTTVGYGDVTPHDVGGRLIGALVMLEGIAFVVIVTAAITSQFVARAERERAERAGSPEHELQAQLNEIEALLRQLLAKSS
jgi:voltage-gated potassium channel